MQIRFTFDDSLSPAIQRAVAAAHDFTPAMEEISDLMEGEIRLRFRDEKDPEGKQWKPSARAIADGGRTLTDTRALLASMARDQGGVGHDQFSAWAGTNVIYAAIHQFGGKIRAKNAPALSTPFGPRASVTMPQRSFLGFGAVERAEIPEILADHLRTAFAGGGA